MDGTVINSYLVEDIKSFLQRFIKCDVENKPDIYYLQSEAFELLQNIQTDY